MSATSLKKSGTDQFHNYLVQYKDHVREQGSDGYYHVDVVAEAYNQGFSDGEKSGKKDFLDQIVKGRVERFTQKANQIYILTQRVVSFLNDHKYKVHSFHINLSTKCQKVIVSVDNDLLLNDEFVEKSYTKVFEMKRIFTELFEEEYLDMSLMGSNELDLQALEENGFGYYEILNS
ncbi:hypothetical protein [Pontibacter populi]|uniref:Uncharacterized protein n=1 Tax=Pontibacter populi TaxID=890055 RepID=A0ABV1RP43_9BACT